MKTKKRLPNYNIVGEAGKQTSAMLLYLQKKEAQRLVNMVCKHDDLMEHYIVYSKKKTKEILATYDEWTCKVTIYHGNGSVHNILHEMAHNVGENHDDEWKACFDRYLKLWDKKWKKKFLT
jgi:PhoPQ-activated pathogenicity-related protein